MKKLGLTLLIIMVSFSVWSQQPTRERIKAMKVAFITEKLNLSAKEAQQFWPVYNAFDETTSQLRNNDLKNIRQTIRQSGGNLSNAEAEKLLEQLMAAENKLHVARVTLVTDLKKVISAEKIIRLKAAEDAFNKELLKKLKQFRERRQNRN